LNSGHLVGEFLEFRLTSVEQAHALEETPAARNVGIGEGVGLLSEFRRQCVRGVACEFGSIALHDDQHRAL